MLMSKVLFVGLCFYIGSLCGQSLRWDPTVNFTSRQIENMAPNGFNELIIDSPINIDSEVIIPQHLSVKVEGNGVFIISDAASKLIILGELIASRKTIFDLSGKKVISYNTESVSNIRLPATKVFYPEWWGLMPNVQPAQDDTKAPNTINYRLCKEIMLDIAASGGGELSFGKGVYYIRDLIVDSSDISIIGQGSETVLKFDRQNYRISTRRGTILAIQGPTIERYYNRTTDKELPIRGNYEYTSTESIANITVKDLTIEWDPISAMQDPAMNGVAVTNAHNVLIENVTVKLYGANRAFYIATLFDQDKTYNVTVRNCKAISSRTGVFILHGFETEGKERNGLLLDSINILNNEFNVTRMPNLNVKNLHILVRNLDPFATGIYFAGSEYTEPFQNKGITKNNRVGSFLIKGNVINNADFGLRCWFPNRKEFKDYVHSIAIVENKFYNYRFTGIYSTFKSVTIAGNEFVMDQLLPLSTEVQGKANRGYVATSITIAKAPWPIFHSPHGPESVTIKNNVFSGCYVGTFPIQVTMNDGGITYLTDNVINYDTSCDIPDFDVRVITDKDRWNSRRTTLVLDNNKRSGNQSTIQNEWTFDLKRRRKNHIRLLTPEGDKYRTQN